MAGANDIGAALSAIFNTGFMGNLVLWLGWLLLIVVICGIFVIIYLLVQYRYKVSYPVLQYDDDANSAQILKWKKDRARIVKRKDGTIKTHFLLKRVYTEPFEDKDIRPGNRVILLRINRDNTYTPLPPIRTKDNREFNFEYINPEEKTWVIQEIKETNQAHQVDDVQKRMLTYTIIAILLAGAIVIVSVWLTLKYTGNVADALRDVAPSLKDIASGLGGTPPD